MAYTEEELQRMYEHFGIDPNAPNDEPELPAEPFVGNAGNCDYHIVNANIYTNGVHLLREECGKYADSCQPKYSKDDKIIRPLTIRENLLARVEDYNRLQDDNGNERSLDDRLRLFYTSHNSCTGIAYKAKSNKFKIIAECEPLIRIANGFEEAYLPINYDSVAGIELDSSEVKYHKRLTQAEVLGHPAWLAAVEDDKALLKE